MDKNDFDIDYDLSKEENIDPEQLMTGEQDDDLDIDSLKRLISDEPYEGDFAEETDFAGYESAEQESLFDDGFLDVDLEDPTAEPAKTGYEPEVQDQAEPQEPAYEEGEEEILRRQKQEPQESYEEEAYPEEAYDQADYQEGDESRDTYEEDYPEEGDYSEEDPDQAYDEEYYEEDYEKPRKEKKQRKPIQLPKVTMPPFFKNFMALYFGAAIAEFTGLNHQEGRRRRSKMRIFKDSYLPALLLVLTLVLSLSCIIGSAANMVQRKRINDEEARQESIAAAEEQDRLEGEYVDIMRQADMAAQEYDFERAVEILDSYSGEDPQELVTKRAEYVTASTRMTEWKDPTGIPNLSFHCLVADPARAYADKGLGGKYNMNFVTTDEFQRILESLYANNYVLVDFDSFVEVSQDLNGNETFSIKPILMPDDKKPVMITETLVSYYDYMVDGNKDGKPDAGGAGFANKLVIDENGDIKAEYIDKDGNTLIGDYDLVPILETFLKQHPDFSYRGSRAILAPTGEQGIFGYRIQTSVISDPKLGQEYYNQQVQGAKELVAALRAKGYTLASYTYANRNYGQDNANQITDDLSSWDTQITPVLGNTNIMVFAQGADIGDYTGTKFKALYEKGFRFFVGKADKPFADVANTYVRQKRLMVTGSNMFWNGKMFTGMFDTAAILNSMRGDVPKAK